MGSEPNCYILHSTSFDSTSVMFDRRKVLRVINHNYEELDYQMILEDFGEIRNEGSSLAQQCIFKADDDELVVVSNEMFDQQYKLYLTNFVH